MSQMIVSW